MKTKLTQLEKSWILYDIGNSAFILMMTALLPIYFNSLADLANVSEDLRLSYRGYAESLSTIIVAILAPICGIVADRKNHKKPIFLLSLLVGVVGCVLLGFAAHWLWFLAILVVAKVGYNASIVFYDSMLPEITEESRMDNISTMGYAYGYIGSIIPFVVCVVLYIFLDVQTSMGIVFLLTAIWWIVCSVPLLKKYRQTAYVERNGNAAVETFKQLAKTFRNAKKEKHIFMYLIAFFFFINGVYTIIGMATDYGLALGLDSVGLLLALLVTQIVAFPCAIIFGRLSAKHDSGKLIKICIICYTCITLFAVTLMTLWQFWLLAILVGMFQGAIQALSRSYLGKIIPVEQSGEYYGLMDVCGKGASFLGTTLISVVSHLTAGMTITVFGLTLQNENLAVGTLVILFAIGYVLFCKADKLNRK
jgi:UMF1 family MFS transporter